MPEYARPIPFHEYFVDKILSNTKDVTRRFTPRHVDELLSLRIGGLGRPSTWRRFGEARVTSCSSERLQIIGAIAHSGDFSELGREGFEPSYKGLADFRNFVDDIYKDHPERQWNANPPIWRIQFKVEKVTPPRPVAKQGRLTS